MITQHYKNWAEKFFTSCMGGDDALVERVKDRLESSEMSAGQYRKYINSSKELISDRAGTIADRRLLKTKLIEVEKYLKRDECNIKKYKEQLKEVKAEQKKVKERLEKEGGETLTLLKKLSQHKKVETMTIEQGSLKIETAMIYQGQSGKEIGHFVIRVQTDGQFFVENTYKDVEDNYDHWCIEHRRVCQGDYASVFDQYRRSGNIYLIVDTIFHFLEEATDGQAYLPMGDWFDRAEKIDKPLVDWRTEKVRSIDELIEQTKAKVLGEVFCSQVSGELKKTLGIDERAKISIPNPNETVTIQKRLPSISGVLVRRKNGNLSVVHTNGLEPIISL